MAVLAILLVCAIGTLSTVQASDVKVDDKGITIIVPVDEKDRCFNITITSNVDRGYVNDADYFEDEQTPIDPVKEEVPAPDKK